MPPANVQPGGLTADESLQVLAAELSLFVQVGSGGGAAGEVSPCSVGREAVELLIVFAEHKQDGRGHVERDQAQCRAVLFIRPSGGGAFAVVEGVATFPDKVVLVAEGCGDGGVQFFGKGLVDALMIGFGPSTDVLQRLPVGEAIVAGEIEPTRGFGNACSNFGGMFFGGFLAAFVEVGAESTTAMMGDEYFPFSLMAC